MNKILLLIGLFAVVTLQCTAQPDSASKAQQIIRLEQRLADASPGDSTTWKKYLDPKWYITDEDGNTMNKKEFIAGFSPFIKGVSGTIKVTKPILIFHGDCAVIHYIADEYETFFGNHLHTTYGTVDTWYKTDTSWMMLSMLSFEIPQLPPAIKVDARTLEKYTGTYKLTDDRKAVISLKNDTLFVQKKGKPEALLPETANVFFRRSDARGRRIFTTNDTGQVLMLERRNGQDVVWKRESK